MEKSLYDTLYEKGKEALKGLNKPLAKRRDVRAFKAAYDEAAEQGDKARQEKNELLEKRVGKYADHIDDIIRYYRTEKAAEEAKADIKECYKEVFSKELKVEEE
jgi:hypothetical protein